MKLKTKSLRLNFLIYFSLFSIIILVFLYFFQILFLNSFYKMNQSSNLDKSLITIQKEFNKKDSTLDLETLSEDNEVCINIIADRELIYHTKYSKRCNNNIVMTSFERKFIYSGKNNLRLEISDSNSNQKLLLYGRKLNDVTYAIVSTPITPMDSSITLLKSQFIYVALVILILSFLISYFLSRRLSNPIEKLNIMAKKLSEKDYSIKFNLETEISELKELSKTLNLAASELGKTEELQREFLANISHDLKTPLTMIEAYASSAKDLNYNNKKKRERDLNIIINEAERLNSLVNDILLLSKFQSKTLELSLEQFDLTLLIKQILESFTIYQEKGYDISFKTEEHFFITADKKSMERVIYNLIINAINYTGDDKKVMIKLTKKNKKLTFSITDTGIGISEKDKKLVWNKYFRINKKHHREDLGTGLGLSIVKEILEEHHFIYGIDSKIKKGTTFYFRCDID